MRPPETLNASDKKNVRLRRLTSFFLIRQIVWFSIMHFQYFCMIEHVVYYVLLLHYYILCTLQKETSARVLFHLKLCHKIHAFLCGHQLSLSLSSLNIRILRRIWNKNNKYYHILITTKKVFFNIGTNRKLRKQLGGGWSKKVQKYVYIDSLWMKPWNPAVIIGFMTFL